LSLIARAVAGVICCHGPCCVAALFAPWRAFSTDIRQVRLNTELTTVITRKPTVRVLLRPRRETEDKHNPNLADQDLPQTEEEFDEIVFCVLADTAKRVLGKEARGTEKWVLGNTTWSDDVTVTHSVSGFSREE
jgi:hypothetical protein